MARNCSEYIRLNKIIRDKCKQEITKYEMCQDRKIEGHHVYIQKDQGNKKTENILFRTWIR